MSYYCPRAKAEEVYLMNTAKKPGFLEKLATHIVDKRLFIIILYIALAVFCAFSRNWVKVNDSLTDYLPMDTETRQGLKIMDDNFITYATAEIMVENITYDRACEIKNVLENTDGVRSVEFDDTKEHYSNTAALFLVSLDGLNEDSISIDALNKIKDELGAYDLYVNSDIGNPLKHIINNEMFVVDIIAFVIIILVLLITSKTYGEIPVLLITFGAGALLNMGTNFLMGEISFVTDSIAIVLQLALAIDYAIILCHRYTDEHAEKPPREAAIAALTKAIPEISASSLTTVSGLLALTFMQYKLGYDMGTVMIKAILLSLCTVFLLMPGLLVTFSGLIDKTHHKSFVPKIDFLGKFAFKTRFVMPVIFLIVFVGAFYCSSHVYYVYSQYSVDSIRKNESQLAQEHIEELFGKANQLAIIVPTGEYENERELIADIESLRQTYSVTGLSNTEAENGYYLTTAITPREFAEMTDLDYEAAQFLFASFALEDEKYGQVLTNLENYRVPLIDIVDYVFSKRNDVSLNFSEATSERLDELEDTLTDAKNQLMNDDWTRIVVKTYLPEENKESFDYQNILHGICARYYDSYYVVGNTTSCVDLQSSFENDNLLISILTVVFVISVLILTFKSVGLPLLLILIIQGSIFCNFSMPFIKHENLFFLTYLIISAIQMGANIDYAIVISSRYMELKETMPLKEAMTTALNQAFPTIITSGTMLASAGIVIGLMTSNETISTIGVYLGVGTTISILLVMCFLPQIMLLGDILIKKTSFNINPRANFTRHTGTIRIDGRVRGQLDGYIDAEVHGIFHGTLNASIEMGNVPDVSFSEGVEE